MKEIAEAKLRTLLAERRMTQAQKAREAEHAIRAYIRQLQQRIEIQQSIIYRLTEIARDHGINIDEAARKLRTTEWAESN